MKNRKLFCDYPHIGYSDLFLKSNFRNWLFCQNKRSVKTFILAMKKYMVQYGYDVKKHTMHTSQVTRHRYVYANLRFFKGE